MKPKKTNKNTKLTNLPVGFFRFFLPDLGVSPTELSQHQRPGSAPELWQIGRGQGGAWVEKTRGRWEWKSMVFVMVLYGSSMSFRWFFYGFFDGFSLLLLCVRWLEWDGFLWAFYCFFSGKNGFSKGSKLRRNIDVGISTLLCSLVFRISHLGGRICSPMSHQRHSKLPTAHQNTLHLHLRIVQLLQASSVHKLASCAMLWS